MWPLGSSRVPSWEGRRDLGWGKLLRRRPPSAPHVWGTSFPPVLSWAESGAPGSSLVLSQLAPALSLPLALSPGSCRWGRFIRAHLPRKTNLRAFLEARDSHRVSVSPCPKRTTLSSSHV